MRNLLQIFKKMNMADNAIYHDLPQSCSDLSDLTVACNQENTGRQVTDQFLSIMSFLQPLVCHNQKLQQSLILVQPTWETSRQHLSTLIDVFAIYYLGKKIQLIFVLEEKHELPILTGLVLKKRGGATTLFY